MDVKKKWVNNTGVIWRLSVCVCVCVYIYAYMYACIYIDMYQRMYICANVGIKLARYVYIPMWHSTEKSGKRFWILYWAPPQNLWATPALTSNILTSGDEAATWWRKLLLRLRPSRRCIIIPCKEIQRWMKIYGSLGVTREIKLSSAYGKKDETWNGIRKWKVISKLWTWVFFYNTIRDVHNTC